MITDEQLAKAVAEVRRDGIAITKSVFSIDEVNTLRSGAFLALTQVEEIARRGYKHKALETVDTGRTKSPALLFWPSLVNETLESFRRDARLQAIVGALLGPNIKQLNNQVYYRLPGDTDSFAWHQDIMFRAPRKDYPGIVEQDAYLQTAIIVDPIRTSRGAIEYVVGSHKMGDLDLVENGARGLRGFQPDDRPDSIAHLPVKSYEADPGDVMIWSALTVHGSAANRSENHRMYYMNGFAKADCSKPWPYYVKNGRAQRIDPSKIP